MGKIFERSFTGFFAVLFLLTSSAFTILVLINLFSNSSSTNNNSATTSQQSKTKLAGTKLAGFTPVDSVPALKITDLKIGSGPVVKSGDTLSVDYTGAVAATGLIFQSSLDTGQPVTIPLNSVIEGWQQGIPGMKVGGERQLLIPAALAYGANPPSGIPPNADLVFDVTVHSIVSQ